MAGSYHCRPSQLLGVEDTYDAFVLDQAIFHFGTEVEAQLDKAESRSKSETGKRNARQAALSVTRGVIQSFPMIPALKAILAHHTGHPGWAAVRPPLVALTGDQRRRLNEALTSAGFAMPGLRVAE